MATMPTKSGAAATPDDVPSFRRRWHVPALVLGVLALLVIVFWRPLERLRHKDHGRQQLQQGHRALAAGNMAAAKATAQAMLNEAEAHPRLVGQAYLLLGSAELAAQEHRAAKEHLLQALRSEATEGSRATIRYRLAKCDYFLGADRSAVAQALENALADDPEDRVEGYGLLLSLWLKEPDPDLAAALKATDKLLAQPGLANPNPIRLKRGEVLLKLGKADEARDILARVTPSSADYTTALGLQAQSWYGEAEWESAIEIWNKIAARGSQTPRYSEALYYMGRCYAELDRWADACRVWEQLNRDAPLSPEALPAVFHLAEARRKLGRDDEALQAFDAAIRSVPQTSANKYVDRAAAQEFVESAWSGWLEAGKYDRARDLARLYRSVAPPGESNRRFAVASKAAGIALLEQAEQTVGTEAETLQRRGRQYCAAAAEGFAAAAAECPDNAELTWSAAESWLRAQEYARAMPLLEQLQAAMRSETGSPANAERRLDVLVALAEAYQGQATQSEDENTRKPLLTKALLMLQDAMPLALHPATLLRAKYLLGLVYIERQEWPEAEGAFKEVVTMPVLAPEPTERRQAVFALGWVLYHSEQYLEAARYFRDAVERYPQDRRGCQARYWLAESYRQAVPKEERLAGEADLGPYRERYRQLKKQHLEAALVQFQQLAMDLAEAQAQRQLTSDEQALLREGRFGAADCLFRLEGRAAEGIAAYDEITHVYGDRVEGLLAFTRLVLCHAQQGMMERTQVAWDKAHALLHRLTDEELKPTKRRQWEAWLQEQEKNLKPTRPRMEGQSTSK